MATALDLVTGALGLCGAYAPGEAPSAAMGQLGLRLLNQLRAQWNAEGVAVYGIQSQTVAVDGSSAYTFGTGGDFASRPLGIRSVYVDESAEVTHAPTECTLDEYWGTSDRTRAGIPAFWAYSQAQPLGSLYLFPVPQSGTLRVLVQTTFAPIANLSDTIPEPDEYLTPMEYGLAILLAPRIPVTLPEEVRTVAAQSYAALRARAQSQPPPILDMDPMLSGTVDRNPWTEER